MTFLLVILSMFILAMALPFIISIIMGIVLWFKNNKQ